MDASKMKIVYVVSDRRSRRFLTRIGVAFINSDGSVSVKLEAIPVSGEMQIRDYVPRGEGGAAHSSRSSPADQLGPAA